MSGLPRNSGRRTKLKTPRFPVKGTLRLVRGYQSMPRSCRLLLDMVDLDRAVATPLHRQLYDSLRLADPGWPAAGAHAPAGEPPARRRSGREPQHGHRRLRCPAGRGLSGRRAPALARGSPSCREPGAQPRRQAGTRPAPTLGARRADGGAAARPDDPEPVSFHPGYRRSRAFPSPPGRGFWRRPCATRAAICSAITSSAGIRGCGRRWPSISPSRAASPAIPSR